MPSRRTAGFRTRWQLRRRRRNETDTRVPLRLVTSPLGAGRRLPVRGPVPRGRIGFPRTGLVHASPVPGHAVEATSSPDPRCKMTPIADDPPAALAFGAEESTHPKSPVTDDARYDGPLALAQSLSSLALAEAATATFEREGLRADVEYRDLGLAAATAGTHRRQAHPRDHAACRRRPAGTGTT